MFQCGETEIYFFSVNKFIEKMIKQKEITIETDIFLDFHKPQSFFIEE